ncbi:hypothetical protein ABIF35_004429 [Bradyrhizobium japonicum]
MTHAVADHPEHRCNQRSHILQRGENGQQQHRSGLDQDVPAEHQRFDLERPGGEQVGRPLEAIVADAEWRERGCAQDAMTGFTAIPCPYSCSF